MVIASGEVLFFSDVFAPRTYASNGTIGMPGIIYGLHLAPGGSLAVVTSNGTYALAADTTGGQGGDQAVIGVLDKVSEYSAYEYGKTVMTKTGLWGLTTNGMMNLDRGTEIRLADKKITRRLDECIDMRDFRECRMLSWSHGPIVAMGHTQLSGYQSDFATTTASHTSYGAMNKNERAMYVYDEVDGFGSWWTSNVDGGNFMLAGVLTESDGRDLIVSPTAIYNPYGNLEDGDETDGTGGDIPVGILAGRMDTPAEMSPVVRRITTSSDNGGKDQQVSLRGDTAKVKETTANGPVIGTDVWGTSKKYTTRELTSRRFTFGKRTDDVTIEIGVEGSYSRIGLADVVTGGQGSRRP